MSVFHCRAPPALLLIVVSVIYNSVETLPVYAICILNNRPLSFEMFFDLIITTKIELNVRTKLFARANALYF